MKKRIGQDCKYPTAETYPDGQDRRYSTSLPTFSSQIHVLMGHFPYFVYDVSDYYILLKLRLPHSFVVYG
jgi:hypothetical protein